VKSSPFTSITFWTALAALIPLLAIVIQYYQSLNPRRLLYAKLGVRSPAGRLPAKNDAVVDKYYAYARSQLNTQIITVVLAGNGRQDIPRGAFDLKKPIIVDAYTPILAVLVRSQPKWVEPSPVRIDGQRLKIGPGPIGKRQYQIYRLLVAAPKSDTSLLTALTDVIVSVGAKISPQVWPVKHIVHNCMFFLIPLVGTTVLATWLETKSVHATYVAVVMSTYATYVLAVVFEFITIKRAGFKSIFLLPKGTDIMSAEADQDHPAKPNGTESSTPRTARGGLPIFQAN
jgi:hypothetical protein